VSHIVRPGETLSSHGHESRVGGKGANQAVAIARAGGSGVVQFYGAIGQDGLWIKERMEGHGIDVGGIIVAEVVTCSSLVNGRGAYAYAIAVRGRNLRVVLLFRLKNRERIV